jgi:hypothetical protein
MKSSQFFHTPDLTITLLLLIMGFTILSNDS